MSHPIPRVLPVERAASDVSLGQLVRAFTAAGGKIVVKAVKMKGKKGQAARQQKTTLVFEMAIAD